MREGKRAHIHNFKEWEKKRSCEGKRKEKEKPVKEKEILCMRVEKVNRKRR